MNKKLIAQLDMLQDEINRLHQSATLINILATCTDLEEVEPCEIESALKGIESLLIDNLFSLGERREFICNLIKNQEAEDEIN